MKFALLPTAFVAALMLTGCNDSNERLLADLTKEKEMAEGVRYYAASSGMNCPVPLKIFQTGETERGLTQASSARATTVRRPGTCA